MYFTETEALRELEILMQMIPGFQPKGYGSMVMPDQIYIYLQEPPPPTYQEMIADTMHAVRYRPFLQRVEELLNESFREKKRPEKCLITRRCRSLQERQLSFQKTNIAV